MGKGHEQAAHIKGNDDKSYFIKIKNFYMTKNKFVKAMAGRRYW